MPESTPITLLLRQIADGDRTAADAVFARVHDELRRIARHQMLDERPGHTLTPTALVHEAYVKLVDHLPDRLEDREHFFAIAARAMRQVLISHAQRRSASKRGGGEPLVTFDETSHSQLARAEEVLAIHEALEQLEDVDPRLVRVVEYRFFAGLAQDEIASLLGVSVPTVKRDWRMARAWLRRTLGRDHGPAATA